MADPRSHDMASILPPEDKGEADCAAYIEYKQAFAVYENADEIQAKRAEACLKIAQLYEVGDLKAESDNQEQAFFWYKKGNTLGSIKCTFKNAYILLSRLRAGQIPESNLANTREIILILLNKAVAQNHEEAHNVLVWVYLQGTKIGFTFDLKKCLAICLEAIKKFNSACAYSNLGFIYQHLDLPPDTTGWLSFKNAVEEGKGEAGYFFSVFFDEADWRTLERIEAQIDPIDTDLIHNWLTQTAKQNCLCAIRKLANYYISNGDWDVAEFWLDKIDTPQDKYALAIVIETKLKLARYGADTAAFIKKANLLLVEAAKTLGAAQLKLALLHTYPNFLDVPNLVHIATAWHKQAILWYQKAKKDYPPKGYAELTKIFHQDTSLQPIIMEALRQWADAGSVKARKLLVIFSLENNNIEEAAKHLDKVPLKLTEPQLEIDVADRYAKEWDEEDVTKAARHYRRGIYSLIMHGQVYMHVIRAILILHDQNPENIAAFFYLYSIHGYDAPIIKELEEKVAPKSKASTRQDELHRLIAEDSSEKKALLPPHLRLKQADFEENSRQKKIAAEKESQKQKMAAEEKYQHQLVTAVTRGIRQNRKDFFPITLLHIIDQYAELKRPPLHEEALQGHFAAIKILLKEKFELFSIKWVVFGGLNAKEEEAKVSLFRLFAKPEGSTWHSCLKNLVMRIQDYIQQLTKTAPKARLIPVLQEALTFVPTDLLDEINFVLKVQARGPKI